MYLDNLFSSLSQELDTLREALAQEVIEKHAQAQQLNTKILKLEQSLKEKQLVIQHLRAQIRKLKSAPIMTFPKLKSTLNQTVASYFSPRTTTRRIRL